MSDYRADGNTWTDDERTYAAACRAHADRMAADMFRHEPGYCLALLGQTTVGKTFLARLLMKWWNQYARLAGQSHLYEDGIWIDWPNHQFGQVEEATGCKGLLVLDEVGRGRVSAAAAASATDRLIDLLSLRENRGLYTVVTANWSADQVPDGALLQRFRRRGSRCIEAPPSIRPFNCR